MDIAVKKQKSVFKIGDWVEVSPELTHEKDWIEGRVFDIIKNPLIGDEIAMKDSEGNIFFGEHWYFRKKQK